MCRTVLRMILISAFCCYDKVYASQLTWQGPQRNFLFPGGQYEEFYCNCWFYTPRCANVCKNYITLHGTVGRSPRPAQMKAPAFNPNTMYYPGPGSMPGSYASGTGLQADVYPGHFPMRHLSIETIISNERLGQRTSSTPYVQGPRKVAKISPQLVESKAGPAKARSLSPVLSVFSGKSNRNTNVESDRRMCELLVWIHQAGANSTDRRQKTLLKGIISHFFRTNNLTEIVCEARGSLASNRGGAYESLYTITKEPYVDVFPPRKGVHVAPSSALGVLAGSGPSRVLYSKIYYTTTITPITTIVTSLDDVSTEKGAGEPSVSKETSLISTMSKADIKQDALIVAGKVQERRSKIENILSSADKEGKFVDGVGSRADTRSKYRTTFVWKTVTPYITKEVLRYPKTAYYTTTELFTITPLTTIYVDDENIDAGRESNGMYTGPGFAPVDDINNFSEKKLLAAQEDIPHVAKHNSRNSDVIGQETTTKNNTSERPKKRNSTDTVSEPEKHKSSEVSVSSVIMHSKAVSENVPDKELQIQKNSTAEKDMSPPSSVNMKSVLEPTSVKSIQSLLSDSCSALTSTVGFTQNESAHSSFLKTQYWVQSESSEAGLATDRKSPHNVTADTSTTTISITTTVILDLERILEGQVRGIVQRKNMLYKEKEQNVDSSHEDIAQVSKSDGDGNKDSVERKKGGDKENSKQQDTKIEEHTKHNDDEEDTRTDTGQPSIKPPDHIEANKDTAVYTSVLQVSDASLNAENMTPAVDITPRSSMSVEANSESGAQRKSSQKKTVTRVFTILTEGESHSSGVPEIITSHTVTENKNGDIAYEQACISLPNIEKELSPQTREHIPHRAHLMDIPLVSAIVHEINAANSSRTVSVTTTKTVCAENRLASAWEKPPVVGMNTKTQEQRFCSDGSGTLCLNTQALQTSTDKCEKSTLLTIRNMVFMESASKETLSDKSIATNVVKKSDVHTRLGSNSPVILRSGAGVNSTGCHSLLVTHYLKDDAGSKTVSTFPIVKKVDIDDNFGVEIKVEPV